MACCTRMPGAKLLRLLGPDHGCLGKVFAHLLAAVAVDDVRGRRLQLCRALEHVREQRRAGERLQHLGQIREHARAATGRENDYRERPDLGITS